MFESFNESARRAIYFSRYEASRLGRRTIESEHILLGALKEGDAVLTAIWNALHVQPADLQSAYPTVENRISSSAELPITEEVKAILAHAIDQAERTRSEVAPVHLVLGILRVPECEAARVLARYGVEYDVVAEISRIVMTEMKRRAEVDERTPIALHASHYEALDQLATEMALPDERSANRQALVLAIFDGIVRSGFCERQFASLEELTDALAQSLSGA